LVIAIESGGRIGNGSGTGFAKIWAMAEDDGELQRATMLLTRLLTRPLLCSLDELSLENGPRMRSEATPALCQLLSDY
jgi:hypothetical protein